MKTVKAVFCSGVSAYFFSVRELKRALKFENFRNTVLFVSIDGKPKEVSEFCPYIKKGELLNFRVFTDEWDSCSRYEKIELPETVLTVQNIVPPDFSCYLEFDFKKEPDFMIL